MQDVWVKGGSRCLLPSGDASAMMAPSESVGRRSGVRSRHRALLLAVVAITAAIAVMQLSTRPSDFAFLSGPYAPAAWTACEHATFTGLTSRGGGGATDGHVVAMRAEGDAETEVEAEADDETEVESEPPVYRPLVSNAMVPRYAGYVHKRKFMRSLILRLDRHGHTNWPVYRIRCAMQFKKKPGTNNKFKEELGRWHPMRDTDDPFFFSLKCDRVCHWLRFGANPSRQCAYLLDRAGLIRVTGPNTRKGEWEWRVPRESGPDAPEGWSYDLGPHLVTWNNKRKTRYYHKIPGRDRKFAKDRPLIERFGFQGYEKIPVDWDVMNTPARGNTDLNQLENTNLPMFWKTD